MKTKLKTIAQFILITSIFFSHSASASISNTFNFTFTSSLDEFVGTGVLSFDTPVTTGTFAIGSLDNVGFFLDIVYPSFETSQTLHFTNIGEGEQIILSGILGSRSIAFNDPIGVNTRFSGASYFINHVDTDLLFDFNNGSTYLSNIQWTATDVPVVPEPISSILFIVGGATLGFRRFHSKRKTA